MVTKIRRLTDPARAGVAGWLQDFYVYSDSPRPSRWRFNAWRLGTWLYH